MPTADTFTKSLFTMRCLDDFVPVKHPLGSSRSMVNQALKNIESLLSNMYAADIKGDRPWHGGAQNVLRPPEQAP
jgi:hypothetical protein